MKKLILISTFCVLTTSTLPMVQVAQKFNKYISHTSTGLFFLPASFAGYSYFYTNNIATHINENNDSVALTTDRYLHTVLDNYGYDKSFIASLKIKKNKPDPHYQHTKSFGYDAFHTHNNERFIFVPTTLDNAVTNYYQNKWNTEDKNLLKVAPFHVVQAAELINNQHSKKAAFASLLMPFIIQTAAYSSGKAFNAFSSKLIPTKLQEKAILQGTTHIVKGILKFAVGLPIKVVTSAIGIALYSQNLQKGADQRAAQKLNNPAILKAQIKDCQLLDKKTHENLEKNLDTTHKVTLDTAYFFEDLLHPAPKERAQILQKVLDEIKKDKQ